MSNEVYGTVQHINLDNKIYQIQCVRNESGTSFILRSSGEYLCTVSMNNKNEWVADCDLTKDQLMQITWAIDKLYKE